MELIETGHDLADADHQRLIDGGQLVSKVKKGIPQECELPTGRIRLAPEARLDDIERQDGTPLDRARERLVISKAQIPFEPDELIVKARLVHPAMATSGPGRSA